jgi:hypothetical protein
MSKAGHPHGRRPTYIGPNQAARRTALTPDLLADLGRLTDFGLAAALGWLTDATCRLAARTMARSSRSASCSVSRIVTVCCQAARPK